MVCEKCGKDRDECPKCDLMLCDCNEEEHMEEFHSDSMPE